MNFLIAPAPRRRPSGHCVVLFGRCGTLLLTVLWYRTLCSDNAAYTAPETNHYMLRGFGLSHIWGKPMACFNSKGAARGPSGALRSAPAPHPSTHYCEPPHPRHARPRCRCSAIGMRDRMESSLPRSISAVAMPVASGSSSLPASRRRGRRGLWSSGSGSFPEGGGP